MWSNPVVDRCINMCTIGKWHFCCWVCGCCGCCHASCCACWVIWLFASAKITMTHTQTGKCATMFHNSSQNSRVEGGREQKTKILTQTMLLQHHCNKEQMLQCCCKNCLVMQCIAMATCCNVWQLQHIFSWVCTNDKPFNPWCSIFALKCFWRINNLFCHQRQQQQQWQQLQSQQNHGKSCQTATTEATDDDD